MKFFTLIFFISLVFLNDIIEVHGNSHPPERGHSIGLQVKGRIIPLEGTTSVESAKFNGQVLKVLAQEGKRLRKGSRILEVRSTECLSTFSQLGGVSSERQRQLSLEIFGKLCYVLASHEGTVNRRMIEKGQYFYSGDTFFHLVNQSALTVELHVPEQDSHRVRVGLKVTLLDFMDKTERWNSEIEAISPELSLPSRTIKVRLKKIDFKDPPPLDSYVFGRIHLTSNSAERLPK